MSPLAGNGIFSPWAPGLVSIVVYGAMVLGLVVVLLFFSSWLGERKGMPEKHTPYESGIIPSGPAPDHYPVPFYLVAVFFLVFDVEAVYIFSWAVAFEPLGWNGWLAISVFIAILVFGLLYIWKKGGLDWGPTPKKVPGSGTSS